MMTASFCALIAYLAGSLSSAIIVSRAMGLPDPRTSGSNNPGATNMLRIGGKSAALITLAGDLLKGLLPVALARTLNMDEAVVAITGLAAFLGHLFPVFFRFQGGKGVATFIGVLYGFAWTTGLAFMLLWSLVAYLTKFSSLAALVAAAGSVVSVFLVTGHSTPLSVATLLMTLILYWRHTANIKRLLQGSESKIGVRS